jgi:phosphate transport system substrate-binding protein
VHIQYIKEMNFKRILVLFGLVFIFSCQKKRLDELTPNDIAAESGTTYISVDESYRPIIQEQADVFMGTYPNATLNLSFKAEDKCWLDLNDKKTELIITTKTLSKEERKKLKNKFGYSFEQDILAYDAMAIIVHKSNKDTLFTKKRVYEMLAGKSDTDKQLVMDGKSATSSLRYVMDSILQGQPMSKNIKGTQGSQEVIDVVSKNPKAIGFLGISWVGNPENSTHLEYLKKISLVSVENDQDKTTFVKPTYSNMIELRYPYRRPITYILKQNYEGVATGFRNFMRYERGQLIFKRAFLMPIKMNFYVRPMRVKEEEL